MRSKPQGPLAYLPAFKLQEALDRLTVLTQDARQAAIAVGREPLQSSQLHPSGKVAIDHTASRLGTVVNRPAGEAQPLAQLDE